ncbi:MAG TPA: HEAT repeat domain-containing protein [Gemmatimonadaceae bacterium]|nr:HEAT repeat domain-containing protein [Gemmatimonadaceae bacterium]
MKRLLLAAILAGFGSADAQTIAQRVARAPDGEVRLQFAPRPGTCGDGRDVIGYGKAIFAGSVQSFGDWDAPNCVAGAMRVSLSVENGQVTRIQSFVSGAWSRTGGRVTDLGTVSSGDAATYFFELVPRLENRTNRARILLPAVLAADDRTVARLVALARDASRAEDTRREALQWIGLLGDASVIPTLVDFARRAPGDGDLDDSQGPGHEGLANAALAALSFLENGIGVPALIDLARTGAPRVRQSAVFWLAQSGDPRAFAMLHTVIENSREDERVRANAIFSLAHGGDVPPREYAYLRELFPRLSSARLKESVIHAVAQDETAGSPWLLQKGRDASESMKIRKAAIFWAGQRDATPTRDLVSFYQSVRESELKEHTIFVLSQRDDEPALNELLRIAKDDADRRMRARALFWLGQNDDPRVENLIGERLAR